MYHPPGFEPIHFADDSTPSRGLRWLSGWKVLAGEPAEQVTLGWALDEQTAIVVATCTVVRLPHKPDRRADAVLQALGGHQLGPAPLPAGQRHEAVERARTLADWRPVELSIDAQVCTGAVSMVGGFLVGHTRSGTRVVTFAALGLDIDQVRLRTVESAAGYEIDPRSAQALDAIEAQMPGFLDQP